MMTGLRVRCFVAAGLFLVWGCGGGSPTGTDAGVDAAPRVTCAADLDCDDGLFCNGAEACAPDDPSADVDGCVRGSDPCLSGQRCDETESLCRSVCSVIADADGDGHDALDCGGDDCDDTDADRFPGNVEVCDTAARDEDCDPATFGSRDADGDGFVDDACCNTQPDGASLCGDDCNDRRRDVHPGNAEACDHLDNNCNGAVDEGVTVMGFADADFDLHGDPAAPREDCASAPGFSSVGDDCDDADPDVHGAQVEICDGKDNDCDGEVDESAVAVSWYPDEDDDGFGAPSADVVVSCAPVPGRSMRSSDCDDMDRGKNPAATERCNGLDDDCDGRADFEASPGDFEDDDGDGFADSVCGGNDCDDTDADIYPGAPELCDGKDNDCDGVVDGADAGAQWFLDLDHDGYGDDSSPAIVSCDPQPGRVPRGGDCDDGDATIHPGAADPCGGGDQNCDGDLDDDGVRFAFYPDGDGDGYGDDAATVVFACAPTSGLSALPGDCADDDPARYPAAPEVCNMVDDDCDGMVDEDAPQLWYDDLDGDGHAATDAAGMTTCAPPAGWVLANDDCDDADATNFPGNAEACDGKDNDCDGAVDNGADADCTVLGGVGRCAAGSCEIVSCTSGRADCDLDFGTGCEVRTGTDPRHCGDCSTVCGLADSCGGSTAGVCDASPLESLAVGFEHTLALRRNGQMVAWGSSNSGQTGASATGNLYRPAASVLGPFSAVSAGQDHSCGLLAGGGVLCWGRNLEGQLGAGSGFDHPLGVRVPGMDDARQVVAGYDFSCALRASGEVDCWGINSRGQLGPGVSVDSARHAPAPVVGLPPNVLELSARSSSTCARYLRAAPDTFGVVCWGQNIYGQLGDDATAAYSTTLLSVVGLPADVVALGRSGAPGSFMCARTASGLVYCWGRNNAWQLADGTTANRAQPTIVQMAGGGPLTQVTDLAMGSLGACATSRTPGGSSLWCWGSNQNGALGIGSSGGTFKAQQVMLDASTPLDDVQDFGVGEVFACALRSGGQVYCWGRNTHGELGDGLGASVTEQVYPVQVVDIP